jgi:hypothetical protein
MASTSGDKKRKSAKQGLEDKKKKDKHKKKGARCSQRSMFRKSKINNCHDEMCVCVCLDDHKRTTASKRNKKTKKKKSKAATQILRLLAFQIDLEREERATKSIITNKTTRWMLLANEQTKDKAKKKNTQEKKTLAIIAIDFFANEIQFNSFNLHTSREAKITNR